MQFLSGSATRDEFTSAALAAAIRATKVCEESVMTFDPDEHQRWCEESVRVPVTLTVGEPEARGAYLKKHTTFLITEPRSSIRVRRRFSDFEWLQSVLRARYVGMLIPSLPEKNLLQSESFIQSRIRGLSLFLQQVMASPYLRGDSAVASFLSKSDDKEWEVIKKDPSLVENGGVGHKRWIKRIAAQTIWQSGENTMALFRRQVDQQEKIIVELTACAKRLWEKSLTKSKDVSVMFSLFNSWNASETTSAARDVELLSALKTTTAVVGDWAQNASHDPTIYELILYESLRYLSGQVKGMRELLAQREVAISQATQQPSATKTSVVNAASSFASRFRSGSDSPSQSQLDTNQRRAKQAAELIGKALLAEEINRFRTQTATILTEAINHFACAQSQLTKKSASIWREYIKNQVDDKQALLQNTKAILDTATVVSTPTPANGEAYFA